MTKNIAVIGAGFSGLSAAWHLHQLSQSNSEAVRATVFESADRVGGVVNSIRRSGFLVEESADSFIVNDAAPWANQLANATGFEELIPTNQSDRRALILLNGKTVPVPEGFRLMVATQPWHLLRSRVLNWPAKLRVLAERLVPGRPDLAPNESLREFAERQVGKTAFNRLVQPLVSGIYTADPDRLSIAAALPQFVELEKRFGSITAGLRHQARNRTEEAAGARYGIFRTAKNGLHSFAEHVANRLPGGCIKFGAKIENIAQSPDGWQVFQSGTESPKSFDGIILATPAPVTANLLATNFPKLSAEIHSIEHAGVAVVCLGYHRSQIAHPLDAFGLVVPTVENRSIVAVSFSHRKFPDRAADDHVLLRVFLGGALRPDLLKLCNEELISIATREVEEILSANGQPTLQHVTRWDSVTPQYHVGHLERVERIETICADMPGFAIAGNAYRGIGIPQCIRSGQLAAESVVKSLR